MMQPATAQLGRSKAALAIGYRLLDTNRGQVQPFTRRGVSATGIPGTFAALIDAPASGGYIVWGTAEQDIAEAPIEPMAPDPLPAMRAALALLLQDIAAMMPATPVIQMDTQPFEQGVSELRRAVDGQVSEIRGQLTALREGFEHLSLLNDAASQAEIVRSMRDRLTEVLGDQAPVVRLTNDNSVSQLTAILEMARRDVDRLTTTTDNVTTDRQTKERFRRAAEALGEIEAKIRGGKR